MPCRPINVVCNGMLFELNKCQRQGEITSASRSLWSLSDPVFVLHLVVVMLVVPIVVVTVEYLHALPV